MQLSELLLCQYSRSHSEVSQRSNGFRTVTPVSKVAGGYLELASLFAEREADKPWAFDEALLVFAANVDRGRSFASEFPRCFGMAASILAAKIVLNLKTIDSTFHNTKLITEFLRHGKKRLPKVLIAVIFRPFA